MEFNVFKCKVMHFGSRYIEFNYSTNGQQLEVVKSEKYLNVLIESTVIMPVWNIFFAFQTPVGVIEPNPN